MVYDNSELPRQSQPSVDAGRQPVVRHVLSTNAAENGCCMIGPGYLIFPLDLEVCVGRKVRERPLAGSDFAIFSVVKKKFIT